MTNYGDNGRPRSPFAAWNPFDAYEYDDGVDEEVPRGPLPLEPRQLASLVGAIDHGLRAGGCDTTLRAAEAWARQENVPWEWLRAELAERGGFCDCEVLFNVVPPDDPPW